MIVRKTISFQDMDEKQRGDKLDEIDRFSRAERHEVRTLLHSIQQNIISQQRQQQHELKEIRLRMDIIIYNIGNLSHRMKLLEEWS
jgi:signal transduction histidine kinase